MLLKALLSTLSKPKMDELQAIATSFQNVIKWAVNHDQEAAVKQQLELIFQSSPILSAKLPTSLHTTIVFILFALRADGRKIR